MLYMAIKLSHDFQNAHYYNIEILNNTDKKVILVNKLSKCISF